MPNTITYHRGDVRDVMATMPDSSVHLVVTSPPFLALRSYLPADHPDKHREIGAETTPAGFIDTMLGLTADWRRLLTAWGSLAVEIGDTYSGSGGGGGDWIEGSGQRVYKRGGADSGPPKRRTRNERNDPDHYGPSYAKRLVGSREHRPEREGTGADGGARLVPVAGGDGWPLAKSLCGIPTLYTWSLAYGMNMLTADESPAGRWRVRNLLTWTRPNPPVGALGDKFRPATSFVTIACTSPKRWFDLDAVRGGYNPTVGGSAMNAGVPRGARGITPNPAGSPPLDWWDAAALDDEHLWQPLDQLPTSPYAGSHFATFPVALPYRLILAMCPAEVCTTCGEPRRRLTAATYTAHGARRDEPKGVRGHGVQNGEHAQHMAHGRATKHTETVGWSDCGHDTYTPGVVLDPFGGSGTTAVAAARAGRDAVLIDIDHRNVALARERIHQSLRVTREDAGYDWVRWTVEAPLPRQREQIPGQLSIYDELADPFDEHTKLCADEIGPA